MKYRIMIIDKKRILLLLFFFTISSKFFAQQEFSFSQYTYTQSLINPGFVGMSERFNISAMHRSQWIGINGAPRTQFLVLESPLRNNISGGINFVRDAIGASTKYSINSDFAYKLKLNPNGLSLSFGIKVGVDILDVDISKLNIFNPGDNLLDNIRSRTSPTFGAGFYVYTNKWYLGVSMPNFLSTRFHSVNSVSSVKSETHFYAKGGIMYAVADNIEIKPSFLLRGVKGSPLSLDTSLSLRYQQKFVIGLSYNYNSFLSAIFGVDISQRTYVGYAYDYNINELGGFSNSSHEILLKFNFGKVATARKKGNFYGCL